MKYLIYGAGGIGGCLAAFLAQGGKDVSLIARGAHLEAIQKNGLVLETGHGTFAVPVRACDGSSRSSPPPWSPTGASTSPPRSRPPAPST